MVSVFRLSLLPHTVQVMGREHRDMDVPALIQELKKSHRWHVETA